jgi:hypothetical protein
MKVTSFSPRNFQFENGISQAAHQVVAAEFGDDRRVLDLLGTGGRFVS